MTQNQRQLKFEYLKTRIKYHTMDSLFDVPILILLYWLNYRTAFIICLILMIIDVMAYANNIISKEKELDL